MPCLSFNFYSIWWLSNARIVELVTIILESAGNKTGFRKNVVRIKSQRQQEQQMYSNFALVILTSVYHKQNNSICNCSILLSPVRKSNLMAYN